MPAYYALFSYFINIPPLVWSGVVGAVVALCGVMINNHFQFKSQTRALDAAATEKSLDRVMALRKEVYLPLAGSVTGVLGFLGKIATAEKIDDKPMVEFASNASKLAIVAETSTAILATNVSAKLGGAYLELFLFAQPAISATATAENAKTYRIEATQKAALIQAKIDELLQGTEWDVAKYDALRRSLDGQLRLRSEHWDAEIAALHQHSLHVIAYSRKMIQWMPELNRLGAQLILALRRDMGQVTDEKAFEKVYADQCAHMVGVLEQVLRHLEAEMAKEMAKRAAKDAT